MKLRFVSHAGFSVRTRNTTLLTDPWLCGTAFNHGWALLSPAAPVSWPEIDYVWISHQHPDHLNFPTLRSIDPAQRARLAVLYQKHASLRIPRVLEGIGFTNVNLLPLNRWITLRDSMEIMCGSVGSMDSWIAIRAEGVTVLNLNDCIVSRPHLAHIARMVGKVTVLLTQFSFANWIGNHADENDEAGRKLRDLRYRVEYLKPEFTVPFASFIYFASQENCWMNDFAVTPLRVSEMGLPGVNFMYPGDEWDSELRSFRSEEAIQKYMLDIASPKPIRPTPPPVDARNIQDSANRMMQTLRSQFGKFLIHRVPPERFYLHDLDKVLVVTPSGKCDVMQADETSRRNARFVLCSQMAWFAFSYLWGWNAMEVSGMYLDRRSQEAWPLAFYLNAVNSDFLNFRSARQSMRTLAFLWAKRHEIAARILQKVLRNKPESDWEESLTPQDEDAFSRVVKGRAG
jgi:hypothetical protein